jgi:hypothetical protein
MTRSGTTSTVAEGTSGLLRLEDSILEAMMTVRYALDAFEKPKARHLDIIRKNSAAFAELAEKIRAEQEKEEAEEHVDE